MNQTDRILFSKLQTKVAQKLRESYPEADENMQEWKGEEISIFREELQVKVSGTVSEKWFYTHIKNEQERLPRVDTLNLFAQYIGENSWSAFSHRNSEKQDKFSVSDEVKPSIPQRSTRKRFPLLLGISVLFFGVAIAAVLYLGLKKETKPSFSICFIDKHTHLPVVDSFLEIKIMKGDETPVFYPLKSSCYDGKGSMVDFVVKGRFYKPLHVKRKISTDEYLESIFLEPDDYSMILHLFANSKVEDWKERRSQLSEMLHDNLKAYEISSDGFTIDVLAKEDFINKMTIPTELLKKITILYTEYEGDQMSLIKFTQQ